MTAPTPPDARITIDLIRQRSSDDAGCWIWRSSLMRGRYPTIRFGGNQHFTARRWAWMLFNKKPIPPGHVITSRAGLCDDSRCVNPDHLECITQAARWVRTNESGIFSTETFRARVSAGKARTSKLSDAAVADILTGHDDTATAAEKHGISRTYVRMLRRREYRRAVAPANALPGMSGASPFAGLERGLLRA